MNMQRKTHKSKPLSLSDMTNDPVLKAFFRRGEDGQPLFGPVSLTPPLKPAPAAAEMEDA